MYDVQEFSLDRIVPDPHQPRKHFDKEKLWKLGRSMIAKGQLEDCEGHPDPEDPDTIILTDGERRWRAANLVAMPTLRVKLVVPENAGDKLMRQILHNSGEPHTTMEYANAFRQGIDEYGMTVAEIAEANGMTVDLVEKDLPLADLVETVQVAVDKGEISKSVARRIATLPADKHHNAYTKAVKGRNAKSQMANVETYIKQVNQQKLFDDEGVPTDEAHVAGQKLISLMNTFTKLHKDGHINGRLKSAVKARSRRIPELKELSKSLARFGVELEKTCLDYEAMAEANKEVA